MSTAKHFLTNIFPSEDFPGEEQQRIISSFRKVAFRKNEYLIKESEIENNYWFIESGFARSYVVDTSGNDHTTDFFTKNNVVIDWSSFFLRKPTQENIQALTDCCCWQLDFDSFQELFHSIQTFREHGRSRLVTGYQAIKKQRISIVADKAKDRYVRLLLEKPHIVQNVSLKHIATFLGITDTSLSRIRKEISEE